MISAEFAPAVPGVTAAGEKEQVQPLGSPLQDSATELLKGPDFGFAVTVRFPLAPTGIAIVNGAAVSVKVDGPPQDGLYDIVPLIWFARLGFPTACTNS